MLQFLKKLRVKFGYQAITRNIAKKITARKQILDSFFTCKVTYFEDKNGQVLKRFVVYCPDLPGLISYKQILEEEEDQNKFINIIGVDDGKGVLKIVLSWSQMGKFKGRDQLYGPKRSLVIAAVASVPESYQNLKILMNLISLNEIYYKISSDLKLANILIGIQTFSAKYPCPYGECTHSEGRNEWVKGKDRTVKNIVQNKDRWLQDNKHKSLKKKREELKKYRNCEFEPLLSDINDEKILTLIPPPPLHTILLGPVNLIIDHLRKYYPEIKNFLRGLHILPSKYHGDKFEDKFNSPLIVINITLFLIFIVKIIYILYHNNIIFVNPNIFINIPSKQ